MTLPQGMSKEEYSDVIHYIYKCVKHIGAYIAIENDIKTLNGFKDVLDEMSEMTTDRIEALNAINN